METIERTDTGATQRTEQRSRWPIVVIVVLAIALVGLIAWMTLAMRPNSPTAAPPEIEQLMEDYVAAFNTYDADTLEALVSDDYRIHSGTFDYGIDGVRESLMPYLQSVDWSVTSDAPYYAVEGFTGTWYVSSEGSTISRSGNDYPQNGFWKVVDKSAGGLVVVEHYFMGG